MTTLDQASGLMDIARSLSQDDIPYKLRCAICNKLAVNAFRLPCCDQAICGNCQASLPESCPVCTHTPVSGDLCKPNKALRTTLKAFLRTEEKKREKDRPQNTVSANLVTPVDTPDAAQTEAPTANGSAEPSPNPDQSPMVNFNPDTKQESVAPDSAPSGVAPPGNENIESDEKDVQQHKIKAGQEGGGQEGGENTAPSPDTTAGPPAPEQPSEGTTTELPPQPEGQPPDQTSNPTQMPDGDGQGSRPEGQYNTMGFEMNQSGYPNMGWNDGSAYSQMAQFMPNGMPHPGMGAFQHSMGMPGMGMDPMAANQGGYGGYQMGMGGMNNGMNMGMNNFNAGQGMYGGWDAQNTMWNGGQDKFNPNAFGNGMGADFGAHSGYAGYNMPQPPRNFPHMHQQQQFVNNDFQNGLYGPGYGRGARGRGRGFVHGGRGRGSIGRPVYGNYPGGPTNFEPFQQQLPQQYPRQNGPPSHQNMPGGPTGPSNDSIEPEDIKKFNDELCPGDEDDLKETQPNDKQAEPAAGDVADTKPSGSIVAEDLPPDSGLREIPSVVTSDEASELPHDVHIAPIGYQGYGDTSSSFNGRNINAMRSGMMGGRGNGISFNSPSTAVPSQSMHDLPISPATEAPKGQGVVGAPAAPRAMREGLPNTGITGIRNRGFQIMGKASGAPGQPGEEVTSGPSEKQRGESKQRSRSGSRSTSRRESRQHEQQQHRRHRSESLAAFESEDERISKHERRRRKSHRDREDRESTHRTGKDYGYESPSVESNRRTHCSRRDGDRSSTRKSRSSHHTSRRHRSRSSNGEIRYRDRDRDLKRVEDDESGPKDEAPTNSIEKPSLSDRASDRRTDKERSHRRGDEDRESKRRGRERDHDRDKKRSRRDRSESPAESEYSSRHHSRRVKRSHGDEVKHESREKKSSGKDRDREKDRPREKDRERERDKDKEKPRRRDRDRERGERDRERDRKTDEKVSKTSNSEKDPHTLEREARNRERLLKEQQRREAVNADRDSKGSRRWESTSKHERGLTSSRQLSYKYEDEESDQARASRIEEEREAVRWA